MANNIQKVAWFIYQNWQDVLVWSSIMVSAIIFVVGVVKKLLISKIPNKLVRKAVLSLLSVVLAFPATAIYFSVESISFDYYLYGNVVVAISTIISYWFYENTCLRDLIGTLGKKVIVALLSVLAKTIDEKDSTKRKATLINVANSLKSSVRKNIANSAKNYTDNDLDNL